MSTISSVSSNTDLASLVGTNSTKHKKGGGKIGEDFDNLQSALTSGDLSAAKTAFATLQTDMKKGPPNRPDGDSDDASSVSGTSSKPKGPDLTALQKALDSGDMSAAKSALTDLMKNAPKPPKHHKDGSGSASQVGGTDAASAIETFLKSLEAASSSTSTASASSKTTSSDPFGVSGGTLDVQA